MCKYSAIYHDNCTSIGFLEPKSYETQRGYTIRLLLNGYTVSTRDCRYVGIGNLHSIIPYLKKMGYEFNHEHKQAYCHARKSTPPQKVNVIFMDAIQRELGRNIKRIPKTKKPSK